MESPRNVVLGILIEMAGILDTSKRRTISLRDVDELVQGEPVDLGVARLTVSVWTGDAALAEKLTGEPMNSLIAMYGLDAHRSTFGMHLVQLAWNIAAIRAAYGWARVERLAV